MNDCCKDKQNHLHDKFKDVIQSGGFYYTVYIQHCAKCGIIIDKGTWVE